MNDNRIAAKHLHRHLSDTLKRARQGERLRIEYYGVDVAALVSIDDLERLENDMDSLDPRTVTLQVTPYIDPHNLADAVLTAYDQDPLAALEALRKDIDKRNAAMGIILKRLATEAQ